ncbi:hypothetical protein BXZ70DRAFT_696804 [Cristinia sonorae]|uniref:Uncharacterized protein n=1 Tax=Cristinia sonorae TaxID=1940300 RepID=A0A8K0UEJ7_9AGAR|nr:hypothetical protein BXZ70DRAFT_696804 [Cristinia sonorae]
MDADASLRTRVRRFLHAVAPFPSHTRPDKPKPHSFSLDIPPEVWGLIIHQASLLYHDPLDTSNALSFVDHHCSELHLATYRKAMKLKTTIALVNKQWNVFGRTGLYEFVWISRASQAKALARTLLMEYIERKRAAQSGKTAKSSSSGNYIRRLHILTPILERCLPADIRTILEFTPSLHIYSDHHSLQRSMFNDCPDPRSTPEELLRLVAHPSLRRLSWTTYGSVPFSQRISPLINSHSGALNLEYLELSCWSPTPHTPDSLGNATARPSDLSHRHPMFVRLPALKALKLSLDNNTFATLASWDMPALRHLSVLSADFSYTGPGFHAFFSAHGDKLVQLELGHSSSSIEEYYLTTPPHHLPPHAAPTTTTTTPISLATFCPNLRELICSADAEWHWQSPDWITPHILLPAHPNVELIGIRDIDKRLREDPDFEHAGAGVTPYFPLYEQLVSLLRRDAFPQLRFVRDLSVESAGLRGAAAKAVAVARHEPSLNHIKGSSAGSLPGAAAASSPASGGGSGPNSERVLQFWMRVVEKCRERGVWCEDYTGVNLTARSLMRAGLVEEEVETEGEQEVKQEKSKKKSRRRRPFRLPARFR